MMNVSASSTIGERKRNSLYLIRCICQSYLCLYHGFLLPFMAFLCIPSSAQIVDSSLQWPNSNGGKGGFQITNHGNEMLNFTFHVKEIWHTHVSRQWMLDFHVSREENMA